MMLYKQMLLCALGLVGLLSLTACSHDEEPTPSTNHLKAPITVMGAFATTRATTGDPGVNDTLAPPSNLYIFAWVQTQASGDTPYQLVFVKKEGLTANDWQATVDNDVEDAATRYVFNGNLGFPEITTPEGFDNNTVIGRVYAIASRKVITTTELQGIVGTAYAALIPTDGGTSGSLHSATSPASVWNTATLNVAGWRGGDGATAFSDLKHLYSNPVSDTGVDANSLGNGVVIFRNDIAGHLQVGDMRLYHCAAKLDFKWEVGSALRPDVSVKTITVQNTPSQCLIFKPTANPAPTSSDGINTVITTDMSNQWIGRAVTYALQPGNGSISYKVTFNGNRPDAVKTFMPQSINTMFTGWYRISATVK